jgi:hypothetical protein
MKGIFLLLALSVLLLMAPPPHSGSPGAALQPATTVAVTTQTSTSQHHSFVTQAYDRRCTTSVYCGSAPWENYTFNVAAYSTLYTTGMAFIVSVNQGLYARVLISQGSTILLNTTAASFTVTPTVNSTPVTEKIILVTYQNGTIPSVGNYLVYTNVTSTIQFALFSTADWNYNHTLHRESLSTYVNTSYGFWLNATTLSIPFPTSATPDYATLIVTENHSGVAFQVSPTALFVLVANEAPTTWVTIQASFIPVASPLPPNPVILLPAPACVSNVCTETATWKDTATLAYDGIYILEMMGASPFNTGSVTVTVNGTVYPSSSFVVSGTNITILPGQLTIYETQSLVFTVQFTHTAAQSASTDSLVFLSYGVVSISLGETLLLAIAVLAAYGLIQVARVSGKNRAAYREVVLSSSMMKLVAVIAILVAIYITGLFAGIT